MTLEKRLEILQNEYDIMRRYYLTCVKNGSTINYNHQDFEREAMLLRKIQETKDMMKGKHKQKNLWNEKQ